MYYGIFKNIYTAVRDSGPVKILEKDLITLIAAVAETHRIFYEILHCTVKFLLSLNDRAVTFILCLHEMSVYLRNESRALSGLLGIKRSYLRRTHTLSVDKAEHRLGIHICKRIGLNKIVKFL